ncbi:MAG: hypothetical protein DHS20C11_36110 [Lysobacteraceae bacterium]|nr:MAG: hypothetical protein DHS20C11_36110 [Xanthomonadaceae bacterium]
MTEHTGNDPQAADTPVVVHYEHMAPDAFRHAQRVFGQLARRRGDGGYRAFQAVVLLVIVGFLLGLAMTGMGLIGSGWLIEFGAAFVLIAMLYVFGQVFTRRRIGATQVGPLRFVVDQDGVISADRISEARFLWAAVDGVFRTESQYIFIVKRRLFLSVPLDAFSDEAEHSAFVAAVEKAMPIETMTAETLRSSQSQSHRLANQIALFVLILLFLLGGLWFWAPWRSTIELSDTDTIDYIEFVVAADDVETDLPLIIGLHGWGDFPERMRFLFSDHLGVPARVILPAAPHRRLLGHSWDQWDEENDEWAEFGRIYREQAQRVAALSSALQSRYPNAGKPLVTGFSQGGTLAYVAAAYHGDQFSASVPISGSLAEDLPADTQPWSLPIRAIHGADDELLPADWANGSVVSLQEHGFDASIEIFPDLGHGLNDEATTYWAAELARLLQPETTTVPN